MNISSRSLPMALFLCASTAFAQAEQLEVVFDLAQYSHPGSWSFSMGCTHNPPTGRTNWVHITVVWLEDNNGNYVTTLHRWGRSYLYDLKAWAAVTGPGIDGVTSATPTSNGNVPSEVFRTFSTGVRDVSWLPDGVYRVRLETTQCELADDWRVRPVPDPFAGGTPFGPMATFTFTKGRSSQTGAPLGSSAPFNNVRVNYTVPAGNAPPGAWAGPDQWRMPSVTPADATTTLTGVVTDPDTANPPAVQWTLVSTKPNGLTASIASPSSATTQVTFSQAGIYTFRLSATDSGGLTSTDDVVVNVNARVLRTTDDAEVNSNNPTTAMGTIDVSGPWTWAWGPDSANRSRAYFRFDLTGISVQITYAALQLHWAELAPNSSLFHDFQILNDAQDDLNGANTSTDYEATLTWSNQSVPQGLASNLQASQLAGSFAHPVCYFRHSYANPDLNPGEPATVCPGRFDVPLNLANIGLHDQNKVWSFFMSPRPGLNNGLGVASDENTYSTELLVVQYWQSGTNLPPVANAGTYATVVDAAPPLGVEPVTFDGSASTDDAQVTNYQWREGGVLLGASSSPTGVTSALALGQHTLELTVSDGAGSTDQATAQLLVEDRFEPNHALASAAVITGTAAGTTYADLYASTSGAAGDWYAVDLLAGTNLTVAVTMTGGNLDLSVTDSAGTVLQSSATSALTETVTVSGAAAGRHSIHVEAAPGGASTYSMTVTTSGGITVTLNPSTGLETAGTLAGAGTVSLGAPAAAAVTVSLTSSQPAQLGFGANPVTIALGATSATFDIVLVDDPGGVPNVSRFVTVTAGATGYNPGSADFQILDNEAAVFVSWDKAAESADEGASPSLQLRAVLSGPVAGQVVVPFTVGGTAIRGTDFSTPIGGSQLTISSGTSATYVISVLNDSDVDPGETVVISMGTPTGASLGGVTTYTLTIADDEIPPVADGGTGGEITGRCGCTQAAGPWLLSIGVLLFAAGVARRRRRA